MAEIACAPEEKNQRIKGKESHLNLQLKWKSEAIDLTFRSAESISFIGDLLKLFQSATTNYQLDCGPQQSLGSELWAKFSQNPISNGTYASSYCGIVGQCHVPGTMFEKYDHFFQLSCPRNTFFSDSHKSLRFPRERPHLSGYVNSGGAMPLSEMKKQHGDLTYFADAVLKKQIDGSTCRYYSENGGCSHYRFNPDFMSAGEKKQFPFIVWDLSELGKNSVHSPMFNPINKLGPNPKGGGIIRVDPASKAACFVFEFPLFFTLKNSSKSSPSRFRLRACSSKIHSRGRPVGKRMVIVQIWRHQVYFNLNSYPNLSQWVVLFYKAGSNSI